MKKEELKEIFKNELRKNFSKESIIDVLRSIVVLTLKSIELILKIIFGFIFGRWF